MTQTQLFPHNTPTKLAQKMRLHSTRLQNGTWTIQNTQTGEHRTFKIKTQPESVSFAPGKRIVSVMSGTDNERHYKGFAFIFDDRIVLWKSRRGNGAIRTVYDYYADMLAVLLGGFPSALGRNYSGYSITGSGRCYICNKKLTNPVSLETGIGPKCAGKM